MHVRNEIASILDWYCKAKSEIFAWKCTLIDLVIQLDPPDSNSVISNPPLFRTQKHFPDWICPSIIWYQLFRTISRFPWEFERVGFNCTSNTRESVLSHFITKKKVDYTETGLTFSRRKLTKCTWFRLAAIWSGVLPLQSTRVILQTAGSLPTKYWTISIAPCSHAMWNAVCLSSFWGMINKKHHIEI